MRNLLTAAAVTTGLLLTATPAHADTERRADPVMQERRADLRDGTYRTQSDSGRVGTSHTIHGTVGYDLSGKGRWVNYLKFRWVRDEVFTGFQDIDVRCTMRDSNGHSWAAAFTAQNPNSSRTWHPQIRLVGKAHWSCYAHVSKLGPDQEGGRVGGNFR